MADRDPDIAAVLTIKDGGRLEVWLREGVSAETMADLLHELGDEFNRRSIRRVIPDGMEDGEPG